MKAIVLAAGLGTRIRSQIGEALPKVMAPICGRPLLEFTLKLLREHHVTEAHINLYYQPDAIVSHFGDGSSFGLHIVYHHEDRLWGTAGSVGRIARCFSESFYVLYGDVLTDLNLSAMFAAHQRMEPEATVALYHVSNPTECGIVELADRYRVVAFQEKPSPDEVRSNLANAGIYVLNPDILDFVPRDTFYDFGLDLFPELLEENRLIRGYPVPHGTFLLDIGTPKNYDKAQLTWGVRNT